MKDQDQIMHDMEAENSVESESVQTDRFYEVSDETIARFYEIYNSKYFTYPVKFQFLGDAKLKNVIDIKKINKEYEYLTSAQVLVKINEELLVQRDEDNIIEILFTEQIDKIISTDKGVKLKKFSFNSNPELIQKYGLNALLRANLIESIHNEQIADKNSENVTSDDTRSEFPF